MKPDGIDIVAGLLFGLVAGTINIYFWLWFVGPEIKENLVIVMILALMTFGFGNIGMGLSNWWRHRE